MVEKGEKYIDRVLFHVGCYVSSLAIQCACKFDNNYPCSRVFNWIDCNNLTSFSIDDLSKGCQYDLISYNFSNMEILTLKSSFIAFVKNFFKNFLKKFRTLKSLNIFYAAIELEELETVFKNNPNIETLVLRKVNCFFDCQLLAIIPKVKILILDTFDWYVNNLKSLHTLNQITKLHLNCEGKNLNTLIGEMAGKGIMEELEL